jgi:Ca2+-binding RTX toxin-like protein
MAISVGSERQHQLGQNVETFEDRLMLTVTGFGMAGDSLVDEYLNQAHTYAQSWVELLGEYRSDDIPLGLYKDSVGNTWGEPRRNGYEYNWARYGATSATLLSAGQHTGLAGQIAADEVSHVAIAIGQNDFLPDFSGPYFDIYVGNWTQTQIDNHVNAVVGRITTALNTVDTNNAKVILSNIIDYGLAPLTQAFFPDAARRQSVTDVINVVNAQLRQLASDRSIPLLDLSRLSVDLLGGSSITIGGNVFTATAGVGVQNIFVDDGVHSHTGTSAIIANAYLQALNSGYGESIPLFSEQEMTTILNLTYSSDTLNFDFPSYVVAPPLVSLSTNNATVAEAGGAATVTAILSVVSAQNVVIDLGFSGTAANVNDYTRSNTQIVIPAGSTTGSITLTAVQDLIDETDETIVVDIASVTNGIESGTQQVAVSIDDDDPAPTVALSLADSPLAEAGGAATVTAILSVVSAQNVVIDLGFSGTAANVNDYTRSNTQIVIPAGSTTGSITLTAVQDLIDETDETIVVDIASVTNGIESGTQQVTATIDDEEPVDFGDAPDISTGTGAGDYQTIHANNGPSHMIVPGLFLGATVDVDNGALQNATANADDVGGALPDDEDGVLSPLDLRGTVGAASTVTLLVTNTTAATATLAGWIDYNRNGVFDNATERATVTVATGTTDGRVTLIFPTTPAGSVGRTYARFRLSTDAAFVESPAATGFASNGEVEDYAFTITAPTDEPVTVDNFLRIASGTNGGPTLADIDYFGISVTSLGDLDGDGVNDLAVGALNDDTGGSNRGAVHVLLLNSSGTVKSSVKIASGTNGGPTLANGDRFGKSVTSLGDLDGDGVADLAVGAIGDDTGGSYSGAVHVLMMNANGSVKSSVKIASSTNGGPSLASNDRFGFAVTSLGDLDGDGVADLAVGATYDNTGGSYSGAVHVLMLNANGSVKSSVKIASSTNGGPSLASNDRFGSSVTLLGDLDGDGVADLVVGAYRDDTGGTSRGAVYVLQLKADGSAKKSTKIASDTSGGPTLADLASFGGAVTPLGDLDGDGVNDLAVGSRGDATGGTDRGAVHVLLLNADGTVKSSVKIASGTNGGPTLANGDRFGRSVTSLGDLDGDGVPDLVVGATGDDAGGTYRGAVHVLFLRGPQPAAISLPAGGGSYELLTDGTELVIRIEGGAELFRQSAAPTSSLTISGASDADVVTVLNDGGVVVTPISFIGGDGNDRFDATLAMGPVTLDGGGGNDTLLGGSQNDILDGGDGVDLVEISGSSITVTNSSASSADVDTLTSVERLLLIAAGPGSNIDASSFTLGSATIVGSGGSDTLLGGAGNDLILAGAGPDSVSGGAGDDLIMGRSGRDTLSGDGGNDTIFGGRGRDTIDGGPDSDELRGGGGPDTIVGGDGDDHIRGGGGRDILDGDDGPDTLIGGGGRDNLAGGLGDDTLNGVSRDDNFNDVVGRDTLIGGIRPAARPVPVSVDDGPESKETPQFLSPPAFSESVEEIDEAFGGPLLPELLEL